MIILLFCFHCQTPAHVVTTPVDVIRPFQNVPVFFQLSHFSEPQWSFYCNLLWGGGILRPLQNVTFGVENTSSFGKVHSAFSLVSFFFFCAMTCRNPVVCWEPMCYRSVLSVSCYLWSRVQNILCLKRSVQSIFCLCVFVVRVCEFFYFFLFPVNFEPLISALWLSVPSPSSTLLLSVFYFFNL